MEGSSRWERKEKSEPFPENAGLLLANLFIRDEIKYNVMFVGGSRKVKSPRQTCLESWQQDLMAIGCIRTVGQIYGRIRGDIDFAKKLLADGGDPEKSPRMNLGRKKLYDHFSGCHVVEEIEGGIEYNMIPARQESLYERYGELFRWLAEQDINEYTYYSNKLIYQKYITINGLVDLTITKFPKNLLSVEVMIRDSTEFSTATKAKLLIILNCPIEDIQLFKMLKEEDNDMELGGRTISKFRSKNGEVVFIEDHNRIILKRKLATDPAASNHHSSHESSVENQAPSAKNARTEWPTHSNGLHHPSSSNPLPTNQEILDYYDRVEENERRNQLSNTEILQNFTELRIREVKGHFVGVNESERVAQCKDATSDEFFGEEDDPAPAQNSEVDAPTSSRSFVTPENEDEQKPRLKISRDGGVPSRATPPVKPPPVKSPPMEQNPVEETPLDILQRFKTPDNQKTVFELLKLFVVCLKEFDHLCPEAINNMMGTLKDMLKSFSDPSMTGGILVTRVMDDFYYLISNWHGSSKVLKHIYENWRKEDGIDGRFIPFGFLQMTLVDIIKFLPPV